MNEHSKLPPSSAARRMACPGSRSLEYHYGRNDASEASEEGTLAHIFAAAFLKNGIFNSESPGLTNEMLEGARYYHSIVRKFLPLPLELKIEKRVNIFNVHEDMWGTPDCWAIHDETLHVFDYKFGHTPVDPFENWQLLAYACGITATSFCKDIYLHIVQPRDYVSESKHKVWHLTGQELESYRQRLIVSETLSMGSNAPLRVSEQCKYCTARHACPALKQAAFGATEIAFRNAPQGLDSKQVGNELKLLHEAQELLGYRITALEAEVQHLLQSGASVDHYHLMPSEGRMTWNVDKKSILELGLLMGIDLAKEEVLTPTQAIKAGVSEETVIKYSERKQSLKLSKIDVKKSQAVFKKR